MLHTDLNSRTLFVVSQHFHLFPNRNFRNTTTFFPDRSLIVLKLNPTHWFFSPPNPPSEMAGPAQTAVDPTTVDPPSVTPLAFTDVERGVFAEVQTALLAEASGVPAEAVRPREIAVVTMLSKCRVDKAVANYVKFVETLGEHGLKISELYQEEATLHSDMGSRFNDHYQVCGVDSGGRAIMWIAASKPTQVSEERIAVHAGVLAWLAVHSDTFTLREGCTFVIDTSQQNHVKKIGNEKKMQRTWQALPLRPQNLFIVGASWGKRIFINGETVRRD